MEKIVFLTFALIYLSCVTNNIKHNHEILEEVTSDELKFFIDLPKEKEKILNNPIKLTIKNVSEKSFIISSPACWFNSGCHLYDKNGNKLPQLIKIKPTQECMKTFIPLSPNSSYSVPYIISLSHIYRSFLESGQFKVYFTYHGEIKDKDGKKMKIRGGEIKSNVEEIEI